MARFLILSGLRRAVEVAAEVGVGNAGGEHVPDGDEHGVFDGDERLLRSASGGDPPVFGRQIGAAAAGGRECGDAEGAFEVGVGRPGLGGLDPAADSLLPGQVPAHDARCSGVGKRVMSAPVSAMITSATPVLIPGMVTSRSRTVRKGSIAALIRPVRSSTARVWESIRSRWTRARKAWCSPNRPVSASARAAIFGRIRPRA